MNYIETFYHLCEYVLIYNKWIGRIRKEEDDKEVKTCAESQVRWAPTTINLNHLTNIQKLTCDDYLIVSTFSNTKIIRLFSSDYYNRQVGTSSPLIQVSHQTAASLI